MVCRLRLCRATQSARASASATVVIASTSTASYSPQIKVDVIGSKPNASPKGFALSPTIGFPGAVKTFTLSVFGSGVFDATGAVMRVPLSDHLCRPLGTLSLSERVTVQGKIGRSATMKPLDERIDQYQSLGWTLRSESSARLAGKFQPRVLLSASDEECW